MTLPQLLALLPFLLVVVTSVAVMLALAVTRRHDVIATITLSGLVVALLTIPLALHVPAQTVTPLLRIDGFALFFTGLLIAVGLAVTLLSFAYLEMRTRMHGEYYILLTLAICGGIVLASSAHFAALFLGLELLSVSLFALVSYQRDYPPCIEAGLKYLVLAGVATSILLFGMALLYTKTGSLEFAAFVGAGLPGVDIFTLAGLTLFIVGVGFKLALAPFHLWAPDVYEGAPAPVTAFIATVSKGAMVAVLLRLFGIIGIQRGTPLFLIFAVLAIASMFIGNLLGLLQGNIKRVLAYSSIANMGYILVAFLAMSQQGYLAALYYQVAYFATLIGAFGIIIALSGPDRDADEIDDYTGLAWRRPWLAAAFTVMLLSLVGIPLTAGFMGKFLLLLAGIGSGLWLLAIVLVINSAISLFYYVRIIIALYRREPANREPAAIARPLPELAAVVIVVASVMVIWLGLAPGGLLHAIAAILSH